MPRSQKQKRAKKPVILLVEDESILINLYTASFTRAGYDLRVASTIEDAIQEVASITPDLILLDLLLPMKATAPLEFSRRAGFAFLRKIRKDKRLDNVPIIVFTNLDSAEDRKTAKRLKAKEFVVKANIVPKDTIKIVEKYLA